MTKQISLFEGIEEKKHTHTFTNHFLFSDRIVNGEFRKVKKIKIEDAICGELKKLFVSSVKSGNYDDLLENIGYVRIDSIDDYQILKTSDGKHKVVYLNAGNFDVAAVCKLISVMGKHGGDWGIISGDGKWRLFENGLFCSPERWFEADIDKFDKSNIDDLIVFYFIFGGINYKNKSLLRTVLSQKSHERGAELTERLKNAVRVSLELLITGFIESEKESTGAVPSGDALDVILYNSVILLHRFIYLFYAESRDVLPSKDERYRKEKGLEKIISISRNTLKSKKSYYADMNAIWEAMETLCKAVYYGDSDMKISLQGTTLFDESEHDFLSKNQIADKYLAEVIDKLVLGDEGPDVWKEIYLDQVMEAISIPDDIYIKKADETMFLLNEGSEYRWQKKGKAKWKKFIYSIEKDCFYANREENEDKEIYFSDLFYTKLRSEIMRCDYKFGPVLISETVSVKYLLNVIDALATISAASFGRSFESYGEACREVVRQAYIVDDTSDRTATKQLGIMLFILSDKPAIHTKNRIKKGRVIKGASTSDIAIDNTLANELTRISKDIVRTQTQKKSGISGFRAVESGMKKIEERVASLISEYEKINALADVRSRYPGEMQVVHLPISFPEVFYDEKGVSGFELILTHTNAMAILRSDESSFLKKRLNIKGSISPYEAALRRYADYVSKEGSICQIASRKYMKSNRAKRLLDNSGLLIGAECFENETVDLSSDYVFFRQKMKNTYIDCKLER